MEIKQLIERTGSLLLKEAAKYGSFREGQILVEAGLSTFETGPNGSIGTIVSLMCPRFSTDGESGANSLELKFYVILPNVNSLGARTVQTAEKLQSIYGGFVSCIQEESDMFDEMGFTKPDKIFFETRQSDKFWNQSIGIITMVISTKGNAGNFAGNKFEESGLEKMIREAETVVVKEDSHVISWPDTNIPYIRIKTSASGNECTLDLDPSVCKYFKKGDTIVIDEMRGYRPGTSTQSPDSPLMLYVARIDESGKPVVTAINGEYNDSNGLNDIVPIIENDTRIRFSQSVSETDADQEGNFFPEKERDNYLQKRAITPLAAEFVKDPASFITAHPDVDIESLEALIQSFRRLNAETYLTGIKGMLQGEDSETRYTTAGLKFQVGKEVQHLEDWTPKHIYGLAALFFPENPGCKEAVLAAGKGLMSRLQNINSSDLHDEVCIRSANELGHAYTKIITPFGNIRLMYDPALDGGYSGSGLLVDPDTLVHVVREGYEEGDDSFSCELYDALILKGDGAIWIDGEAENASADRLFHIFWDRPEEPTGSATRFLCYYLLVNCPGINEKAVAGQVWRKINTSGSIWEWVRIK